MNTKSSSNGFTLIEVMITISIFMILVLSFYSTFNNTFQKRTDIRAEISEIKAMFESARNMSIASKSVSIEEGGTTTNVVPKYGYGVYTSLSEYDGELLRVCTLFADTNDDGSGNYGNGKYDSDDTILATQKFFLKGYAKNAMEIQVLFTANSGMPGDNKTIEHSISDDSAKQFTVMFSPLDAHPSILYDNDPDQKDFSQLTLKFFIPDLIEENISFNVIANFFEQERICPSLTINECSAIQP